MSCLHWFELHYMGDIGENQDFLFSLVTQQKNVLAFDADVFS